MKKQLYIAPAFEVFDYQVEEGFAKSLDLEPQQHFVMIDGQVISEEEFSEYTDNTGQAATGEWE